MSDSPITPEAKLAVTPATPQQQNQGTPKPADTKPNEQQK